jgi:hypothetical protein
MNHRLAVAGRVVIEERIVSDVARYEQSALSERHKVVLRYADAYLTSPASIDVTLRGQIRQALTPAEIVEVMLDVSAWSRQKVTVSLGRSEPPPNVTLLEFDAAGYQLEL